MRQWQSLCAGAALFFAGGSAAAAPPATAHDMLLICGHEDYEGSQSPEPTTLSADERAFLEAVCAVPVRVASAPAEADAAPGPAATPDPALWAVGDPQGLVRRALAAGWHLPVSKALDRVPSAAAATAAPLSVTAAGFESALLWGLGDFLVKRSREELDLWLLNRIREYCDRGVFTGGGPPTLRHLLPHSCALMGTDVLPDLLGGMGTLRAALRKDLQALPQTLGLAYAEVKCAAHAAAAGCDAAVALSMVASMANGAASGAPPLEALLRLVQPAWGESWGAQYLHPALTPVSSSVVKALFLLDSIAVVEGDGTLRLERLSTPSVTPEFAQAVISASLVNSVAFWRPRKGEIASLDELLPVPERTIRSGAELQRDLAQLLAAAEEAFLRYRQMAETRSRPDAGRATQLQALARAAEGTMALLDLALRQGEAPLLAPEIALPRQASEMLRCLAEGDYASLVVQVLAWNGQGRWQTTPAVARLLSFGVELAQAQDGAAMESAFEHFAAPAGSSLGKRDRPAWHVNLNAYVGGFVGSERATAPGSADSSSARSLGAWVPVGFEVGRGGLGGGATGQQHHSLGLFVHAIDVGALASYRVSNAGSSIESAPTVSLKRVFSPGVFVVWGIRGLPLTVGAGVGYTPELRAIKGAESDEGAKQPHAGALRIGLSLALDIPLFP